jgi:hypothetical protein
MQRRERLVWVIERNDRPVWKDAGDVKSAQAASFPISPSSLTSSKRIETCLLTPDSCIVTP